MPDKKTYNIDENALRDKLQNYKATLNSAHLELVENEMASLKTHKPIALPETKQLLKFVLIPIGIAGVAFAAYFGFHAAKNMANTPKPITTEPAKQVVQPSSSSSKPSTNTTSVTIVPPVKHTDTIVGKTISNNTTQVVKKAEPVIAKNPAADTTPAIKIVKDTITPPIKADSSKSVKKQEPAPSKKKKRRRKNSFENMDDVKKSTLQPNTNDDNVVVPN